MHVHTPSVIPSAMFIDAATAARIDRVEARLSLAVAAPIEHAFITALHGGASVVARPGSPINKIIGVGFDTVLDERVLADIEAGWRARGEPVRVELATLALPAVAEQLGARGYRLAGFEHVLVRPISGADAAVTPPHPVHREHPEWHHLLVDGFATPDGTGVPVDDYSRETIDAAMTDFARADGFHRYVAAVDGAPAGAATMRIDDGIALLCGATTLPTARRRGVQAALLAARLRDASHAGCEYAAITTAPGSRSQHNAVRHGFHLAYARAILVQPTP